MTPEIFRELADLLPEPMFLVSGSGRVVAENVAARQLGVDGDRGEHLADLVRETPAEVERFLKTCARQGQMVPGRLTFLTASGDWAVQCEAGARHDASSEERYVVLRIRSRDTAMQTRFGALTERIEELGREIHRRRRAESAVAEREQWLRITMASIGDAVIVTNESGCIAWMNRIAETLTGWGVAEVEGRPLDDVFHILNEATREPIDSPVEKVLKDGVTVGLGNHTILVSRDGTERAIDDSAAPIRDGDRMLGVVLVFRDVSDERAAQKALHANREELRRRAEELAAGDRRKDEFLATLAHELRNPLAPIRTAVEVLARPQADDHTQRRAREIITRQLVHMVRLIEDLLDLARINQNRIELRRQAIPLSSIIETAVETSRPLIDEGEHELVLDIDAGGVLLEVDPTRLAQVVSNILNNAAKYTPRGGRIALHAREEGRDVLISVRDSGMGITAEQMPFIFEPFLQAAGTRSRGGLGIGLALVRRLVELHGGEVWAESGGQDQGAEFIVRLPVPETAHGPSASAAAANESRGPSRRVLVVDDNRDAADSLRMLLELEGHAVWTAYDGPQALDLADSVKPEVVLLDIGMPGLNGYEVATRLREMPSFRGALLIAMTGWGQPEDRRRAVAAGFDVHLAKPVDPTVVNDLIAQRTPKP